MVETNTVSFPKYFYLEIFDCTFGRAYVFFFISIDHGFTRLLLIHWCSFIELLLPSSPEPATNLGSGDTSVSNTGEKKILLFQNLDSNTLKL